jgi:hypothetical protein
VLIVIRQLPITVTVRKVCFLWLHSRTMKELVSMSDTALIAGYTLDIRLVEAIYHQLRRIGVNLPPRNPIITNLGYFASPEGGP